MSLKKKTDIDRVPSGVKSRVRGASVKDLNSEKLQQISKSAGVRGRKTNKPALKKSADLESDISVSVDPLENLGSLPRSYGEEVMFLVAQDPHWLFTYWDIDISRHPGGPCILRVEDGSGELLDEIEVAFETRNWYIPVKKAGGAYAVELGFQRYGKWNRIARSSIATTPRDRFSDSAAFEFATLPMHISFQRLVENLSHSFASSEELLPALMKLQRSLPDGFSSGFSIESRDREILQSLLGSEILAGLSSGRWNSEELHSAISARIRERLSSAEVVEFFSRLPEWNSESPLSSGFQKLVSELSGSSSFLGSAEFAGLIARIEELQGGSSLFSEFQKHALEISSSAMGSAAFASLLERLQALQAESSLFSQFQKLSAEISSSAFQPGSAAYSELLAVNLSSWLTGLVSSWGGGSENRLLSGVLTSWSGSELSSASELAARAALSSWLAGASSSWKGSEVSMQALAAISSWSSEIMAGQGFAASSWSASQN